MTQSLLTAPETEVDKAADAAAVLPVAEAAATAEAVAPGQKPAFIPGKFWDSQTKSVRLEQLARSYQELEKRMHSMVSVPGPDAAEEDRLAFSRALGVPETPDGYTIEERHPLLGPDPELNATLHAAGFTPQQAQLVYDLAAERVLPVIEDLASEFEADRQLVRLVDHFGGEERWREISRQILTWGKANLPEDTLLALSSTYEGVLALHRLMTSGEPALNGGPSGNADALDEDGVKALMRDPKYWRDKDTSTVKRVTGAFRKLYPET